MYKSRLKFFCPSWGSSEEGKSEFRANEQNFGEARGERASERERARRTLKDVARKQARR